jgi:hypothetical protein
MNSLIDKMKLWLFYYNDANKNFSKVKTTTLFSYDVANKKIT